MGSRRWYARPVALMAFFGLWNVAMYLAIHKFWIGGSSFLPLIGKLGPENKFLFAFVVNLGVIAGAFLGALSGREFRLRPPRRERIPRMILGGVLIGMGVTIAPGTCTTAFVTGMPMLSVSSFLSAAGIFLGAYIMFRLDEGRASA